MSKATIVGTSIIRSNEEKDDETGAPLFWSNVDGWVDRDSATVFEQEEAEMSELPLGDCEWVPAGPEYVAVYAWENRGGYLYKTRTKTVAEVHAELRAILGPYPEGGEEYFLVISNIGEQVEWPQGDIVCFSVNGSSEGDYTHVEVHYDSKRTLLMLGKTFAGRDASWAFARRLADLLEIQ